MLQLNEKWRINSDRYNWILEHRRVTKATGIVNWYASSYHGTLQQAINKFCGNVLKNKVNESDVNLGELSQVIEDLKQTVNAACANIDQRALKKLDEKSNELTEQQEDDYPSYLENFVVVDGQQPLEEVLATLKRKAKSKVKK